MAKTERLRDTLMRVLENLGGCSRASSWHIGGSQEVETVEVEIADHMIVIESETFVGISISGNDEIVEKIRDLVERRLSASV